jgi:cytochrome c553
MKYSATVAALIIVALAAPVVSGIGRQRPAQDAATFAAENCASCHGPNGNSTETTYPRLAGQQKDYLEVQLKAFRGHERLTAPAMAYMLPRATRLSDARIAELAEYYSQQKPAAAAVANSSLLANGQLIFERGIPSAQVVACKTCHGSQGQGAAVIPRIASQHADYIVRQLAWFKNEQRSEPNAAAMHAVTSGMDLQQMIAVAAWASHLRN